MATKKSQNWWQGTVNPFPRAAVARTSTLRPDAPTIPTAAVMQLQQVIDEYVRETLTAGDAAGHGDLPPNDGRVIVVEGNYGTGKTHLVLEALGRVEGARKDGLDPRPCYKVAPGGSFLLLYTEIMRVHVGVDEMLRRVLEFYADLLAEDLRGYPFMDRLIDQLQRDEVDPQVVVQRYGLGEGALRAKLRHRLSDVTGDEAFSRALMLLLQPELREIAWDWFTGGTPGQLLSEHGISRPIETDIHALEALGVIARLYRRKGRRFVLAIDEMERLVLAWDRSDQAKAQAFKKLLEVFRRTGALLIMAGLPEIFQILPPETRRVDAIIPPSDLKPEDINWYIQKTMEVVHGRSTIEPFDEGSINYIFYLTGGLAREVVLLCYHAYEIAGGTGGIITTGVISRVARSHSQRDGKEVVRDEIRRLLSEQARNPGEGLVFPDLAGVTLDFWIPIGDQGAGCAVLIGDSILDDHQAGIAVDRISRVRASGSGRAIIQVVSGYLPIEARKRIEEALKGQSLIVYSPRTFADDFPRVLSVVVSRTVGKAVASSPSGGIEFQILREETERLVRQQATMMRLIQESANRDEQLLGAVHRTLTAAVGMPGAPGAHEVADLPAVLEEMFGHAERSLTAYGDVSRLVDDTFGVAAEEPGTPFSLVYRLRDPDAFSPIGVTAYLTDLLRGFRRRVREWLGPPGTAPRQADRPTAREREWLRGICQTYDALYGVAPLFKLDKLPEITSPPGAEQEQFSHVGRTTRHESLRDAFDGLGDRVYEAAIQLVESAGSEGPTRQAG